MDEADAIVLVVDARSGLRAGDAELARILRGSETPVVVAVNKVDRPNDYSATAEFHGLGLGDPLGVSATHGLGTGDLLDAITTALGDLPEVARGRRRGPDRRDRPPQRRQVLDGQRLPRLRPGDRLRHGGHHPRRDRHRARGRRPPRDPRRHRRAAPPLEGRRDRRLLRPAALRTGGRAGRRGDHRLRRRRGGHLGGPAGRRDGDARRLRVPLRAQQVGHRRDRHRRRADPRLAANRGCARP